jgi:hypothetical protein
VRRGTNRSAGRSELLAMKIMQAHFMAVIMRLCKTKKIMIDLVANMSLVMRKIDLIMRMRGLDIVHLTTTILIMKDLIIKIRGLNIVHPAS